MKIHMANASKNTPQAAVVEWIVGIEYQKTDISQKTIVWPVYGGIYLNLKPPRLKSQAVKLLTGISGSKNSKDLALWE